MADTHSGGRVSSGADSLASPVLRSSLTPGASSRIAPFSFAMRYHPMEERDGAPRFLEESTGLCRAL